MSLCVSRIVPNRRIAVILSTFVAFIYLFLLSRCRSYRWVSFQLFWICCDACAHTFFSPLTPSNESLSLAFFFAVCLYCISCLSTGTCNLYYVKQIDTIFVKSKWWQQNRALFVYKSCIMELLKLCALGIPVSSVANKSCPNIVWEHAVYWPPTNQPFQMKSNTEQQRQHTHTLSCNGQWREKKQEQRKNSELCLVQLNVFIISEEQIQFHRVVCILFTNRLSCFVSCECVCMRAAPLTP